VSSIAEPELELDPEPEMMPEPAVMVVEPDIISTFYN
jgi:hypothetical protein